MMQTPLVMLPRYRLNLRRRRRAVGTSRPVLRFTPHAWAKLTFLRDVGPTEVGGFGISDRADLLRVTDIALVAQEACAMSVRFADAAVADFFDAQVDQGRRPEEFGRIWIHTHPGRSPLPSGTDEETFSRVFGRPDWAVMFILARGGATYGRLKLNGGIGAEIPMRAALDFSGPIGGSDEPAWQEEYERCVEAEGTFFAEQSLAQSWDEWEKMARARAEREVMFDPYDPAFLERGFHDREHKQPV